MTTDHLLSGLVESVNPRDDTAARVRSRILTRLKPQSLQSLVAGSAPDEHFASTVKNRVLCKIRPALAGELQSLAHDVRFPVSASERRSMLLSRLIATPAPVVHAGLKWAVAFVFVLLAVRALPLVLLAPETQAGLGVQMIPSGPDVSVYVGGIWRPVTQPEMLRGSVMIRTGDASRATIVLSDQGVVRLAEHTTIRFNDLGDRATPSSVGVAATILRGRIWALGLIPPVVDGITFDTARGLLSLNSGSVSLEQDDTRVLVETYDHGATFQQGAQAVFMVAGEKIVARGTPISISMIPIRTFSDEWVTENLTQDAAHRIEITKILEERRERIAGILPTSFLYPAKRVAEEVDYLFALTQDGRTEKRVQQANTRLSEALTLLSQGDGQAASGSLVAYKDSLIALAGKKDDNIVKYLVREQIAQASASLNVDRADPDANAALLTEAIEQVGAVIPDAQVSSKDVEGYVLVDKLAAMKQVLSVQRDSEGAAALYAEVSPFLQELLDAENGVHPLLRKEATALLASSSVLLREIVPDGNDIALDALQTDMAQYLPPEPEQALLSEEEIDRQIKVIMDRIYVFRSPRSRYNQLLQEMQGLQGHPRRGVLLRRLRQALPEGLGDYVLTEIKKVGDELKNESK
ncbi:MAG: DUF5667 domain-containing protein [Candidatus Peribacteraceae bacterium]|nr:DUF5667 domain-containing protein [Candidatus Peribacteraceae bacterium]